MLKVEGLNVSYGHFQVLWDVSLYIQEGEVVCLFGPNGAGKSTLLHTISGLIRPRSGFIRFLGERIDSLPAHRIVEMGLAHVPERRRVFPRLTVLQNLRLGAYPKRAKPYLQDTLEWVFASFPVLKAREHQVAGTLSGGEQQMLAIARGLMARPKLLMVDEPFLGLAPKVISELVKLLQKIHQEGVTVLLVEQNVELSLKIAHRGYLLESGHVVLEGRTDTLLEHAEVKRAFLGL